MTADEKREVETLASTLLRRYFCDGDVDYLISTFTDDIVWLGGGEWQKAEGAEAVARWFTEAKNDLMACRMWDEEYVTVRQAPGVYLCEGSSLLESVEPGMLMRIRQRITFIFRRENGALKTAHIHNSVPFDAIKPEEAFPIEKAREAFRQLEHRLGEQDRQIELMLRSLPGGMMICYPGTKFTTKWISDGLCGMLGYADREEYRQSTGNSCSGFIFPEDYDAMLEQVDDALSKGDSYSVEYRVATKQGGMLWVLDMGKRYVDQTGETVIGCFITDISDRVRREQEIRRATRDIARQAQFLSHLYNSVPCGIIQFVIEPAPRIININPQALDIYGRSGQDAPVHDPFGAVMLRDLSRIRDMAETLFHNGGRSTYEREVRRGDGSSRWISVIMERLVNADGIQVIQAIFTDITKTKKLQLEREQEQLLENRSLRAAVCAAYELIFRVDLAGDTYETLSEQNYVVRMRPDGTFTEALETAAIGVHPSYRSDFLSIFSVDSLRQRFDRGEKELYYEYRRLGDDGEYHWVSTQCVQVESPDGKISPAILMIKVLDDQRAEKARQEQLLRDALAAAQAANRAKSDFLSRMSHDIRTPMNAIIGMSAIGQLKLGEREQVRNCFSKIDASSRYLLSLINDILDMSRIESGKIVLSHSRFDFAELINQVNAIIYPQAAACGVDYEIYHQEPLQRHYLGDALRINQILMNLLSNALKFTPAGGRISVNIREQSQTGGFAHLEFVIADTGSGMSPEFMQRIFQPFEQENADAARNQVGSGLGLSIVYNLVQLMGGNIDVRSRKGHGAAFTVVLPLQMVSDDAEAEKQRKTSKLLAGLRVLVADDDEIVGEQAVAIMNSIGAESLWVDSGFKAVEAVRAALETGSRFDVALIDWKMPGMDGIETTRRIRRLVGPETTIIIISAYDWTDIEAEARAAGADHFISKPLFRSTLRDTFLRLNAPPRAGNAAGWKPDAALSGKRLLLVEDNEINMEIARSLLEMHGLRIDTAENGQIAVRRFQEAEADPYQAILMDIRMPVLNGLDATRAIRSLPKADAKTVPIIAMSANAFEEDKLLAIEAGMNDYLVKPVELDELFAVLGRWL